MTNIILLIYLFLLKIILIKIINIFNKKLDILHKLSTIIPIIIFLLLNLIYFDLKLIIIFKISLIFLIYSYIFITIPGGYASSVRLKILSYFPSKKKIEKKKLSKLINDKKLFEDRFNRVLKYSIIDKKKFYFLKSKQIKFFLIFVKLNRKFFKLFNQSNK